MINYPSHFENIIKKTNPKSLYLVDLENYIPSDHWLYVGYEWPIGILKTIEEFKAQTRTYIKNSFISQYDDIVCGCDETRITIKNFDEHAIHQKYRPREIHVQLIFLSGYLTRLYIDEKIWDKDLHHESINAIVGKENAKYEPPKYIAQSSNEIIYKSYIYKNLRGIKILGGFYRKAFGSLEIRISLNNELLQI